jgi:hypothetical protein
VVDLRGRVKVTTDPAIHEASAEITITLKDGRRIFRRVERAIGSLERPLSDADINEKFRGQAVPIIGAEACDRLIDLAWRLPTLKEAADVARAAAPRAALSPATA